MGELYWIYAFNMIVNSSLSFFTTVLLIEIFARLLRITHPRTKVICYFLPFCKICLDLFLYRVSNWALLHETNPIIAETGTRQVSIMINPFVGIQFSMLDGRTFSPADLIALSIDPFWTWAIVSIALFGAIITCALKLIRIVQDKSRIDLIVRSSTPIHGLNLKPSLVEWMKKKRVQLAKTSIVHTPCIARKTILFPAGLLNELSLEHCEAIIAHEMAHFHWRDCGLRLAYSLIATVFWWIPTGWWQKRIEEMQEQASDSMIHRFGISKFALAEAILQTAQKAEATSSSLAFSLIERRSSLKNRMKMILQEPMQQNPGWKAIQYGLLSISLLSILFGKLWIF